MLDIARNILNWGNMLDKGQESLFGHLRMGLVEVSVKGIEALGVDVAIGFDAGQKHVEDLDESWARSVPGPRFVERAHTEMRRARSAGGAGRLATGGILRSKTRGAF